MTLAKEAFAVIEQRAQHEAQTVLSDTLLNCVGVKHCSRVAPREEHRFNKAGVKVGFPLGPRMLKIYACSWYYQAL